MAPPRESRNFGVNEFAHLLGLRFPLIQAGMGGIAGPELAGAVSSAGAGGVLALYRMREPQIRPALERTLLLTDRPFGVNLIPELMDCAALDEQVEAVLDSTDRNVFFTFYGSPDDAVCERLLRAGRALLITVGSAAQMKHAQHVGATAVILQGTEAGGHLLGSQPLYDLIVEAKDSGCQIPFLGAGGIASGTDFKRIQAIGACGCVCGTVFVATSESEAHPFYKQRLVESAPEDTVITDIFDIGWRDRRHRVLHNPLTTDPARPLPRSFIAEIKVLGRSYPIPRYSAMVPTAATRGSVEQMAMYCGESVGGVERVVPARDRVNNFIAQFNAAVSTT